MNTIVRGLSLLVRGRFFYGFAFCVLIPCLLWNGTLVWEPWVKLEAIHSVWLGGLSLFFGVCLMAGAMVALKVKGGGLPMNAFPPPKFVSTGFYGIVPHPIYWGFCLSCAGVSLLTGASAGLYVMTPLSMLGCAAIVWGYERQDLIRRFGSSAPPTLLGLPPANGERPGWVKRFAGVAMIGVVWALAYYGGALTGVAESAPDCRIFGEDAAADIPDAAIWIYQSIYLIVPLVLVFSLNTNAKLRCMELWAYGCFGLGVLMFLMFPLSCPLDDFYPVTLADFCLQMDREGLPDYCIAFPSFHVLWALMVAGFAWRYAPRWLIAAAVVWACALAWSCVETGMHGWLDVLGALAVFFVVAGARPLARAALELAERLANSWRACRIGPLRIINHGAYVFLAAFLGYVLAVSLAGREYRIGIAVVAVCSLLGAGVWAQVVEGSARLLRPFGYYGAILGGLVGVAGAALLHPASDGGNGFSGWVLFAAMAVASPWIQAIGRLRCLVQGCCHGHPVGDCCRHWGIVHTNPASRVCRLTEWAGVPLHATALYSIGFNIVSGWVLVRLWCTGLPAGLLIGLYFVLAGLSRFVEEAYRGEPQTGRHGGLSDYQWLAVGFVCLAFVFWNIPSAMVPVPLPSWNSEALVPGGLLGVLYAFCMSMDFPDSNKRFSRLTS